jgi:signal transduction histidine kinase
MILSPNLIRQIIEELFEYTKLSNNYIKLNKVPFNIAVLVNQIVGEHILFLSQKNITVDIQSTENELVCEVDIKNLLESSKMW